MDLTELKKLYAQCQDEPLDPGDPRNVDIDSMKYLPRGVSWVDRLARPIELSSKPVRTYFTGVAGSGKSTELRRLSARLTDGSNLLSVLIDAAAELDLTDTIDVFDIFVVLLNGLERQVLAAEGRSPAEAMREGYFWRLWSWLTAIDLELLEAEYAIPDVGELAREMKHRPNLRRRVRQTVSHHLTTFLRNTRDELVLLTERAKRAGREGLVVILDSLEKLRGTTTSYDEVLRSAEQLFSGGAPLLHLPIHSVFTAPASLATRQIVTAEIMTMVKHHDRDGSLSRAGFMAMRELIRRRIPDEAIREILGEAYDLQVQEIIVRSGGYLREVVRTLARLLEARRFPVTDDDLKMIRHEARETIALSLLRRDFSWLAQLAKDKVLIPDGEDQRSAVDRALMNNLVLRYCDTDIWHDLHPTLYEIASLREVIEAPRS